MGVDENGNNLLDYTVLYYIPKEIFELVANTYIEAGQKITKFHLTFAMTIGCEQGFIEKLKIHEVA